MVLTAGTPAWSQESDRPAVDDHGVPQEQAGNPSLPTLWIAGDSTVKCNSPMRGWDKDLGDFFDPKKINGVNRAIGGCSSWTFYDEGRWQEIVDGLKKDDFVIIQFGHNDVSPFDEKVTKPDGSVEHVHSFA